MGDRIKDDPLAMRTEADEGEPVRIGFAQVVPRHMTAPPQWIGG